MTEDDGAGKLSEDQVASCMAAWGHSVVEIKKDGRHMAFVAGQRIQPAHQRLHRDERSPVRPPATRC